MSIQRLQEEEGTDDVLAFFALAGFFFCYILAALVIQVYSGIHPTLDSSPLDYFTGGALWILSAICLLNGMARSSDFKKLFFWLSGSAVLAALAIDEFVGVHEASQFVVGDDDHIKVILWAGTPIALFLIWRALEAPRFIAGIFAAGWLVQSTYLATDVGDGDYFSLPFAMNTLQWTEDICELIFVSLYLFAFMLITAANLRDKPE